MISNIFDNPKIQIFVLSFIVAGTVNLVLVPIFLWLFVDGHFAINYFLKIGIGVFYLGFTLGSIILYNYKDYANRSLNHAKERVSKARKLAAKGNVEAYDIESERLEKLQRSTKLKLEFKEASDIMSLVLRGGALIGAMMLFLGYFGNSEDLINKSKQETIDKIAKQEEMIRSLKLELKDLKSTHSSTMVGIETKFNEMNDELHKLRSTMSPKNH